MQGWQRPLGWLRSAGQFFFALSFSSLTRRIVSLNLAGLVALVASILYLSQFRAGLIDARAQSLLVQGEIIAGAIAASATVETNTITIDPDRLLDLKPGETYGAPDEYSGLVFPINPERVAPVLRTLISPTKTRARIYDREGGLILDSRNLENVLRFELPPPSSQKPGIAARAMIAIRTWLNRGDLPLYRELGPENGNGYEEVANSLKGQKRSMVRVNQRGEVIVSVAVPVQRGRSIHGALMLSTQGDDIDQMVTSERLAILKVGGVASAVMIVLSLLLASTIAGPVRRLADSAERVRRRIRTRVEIPDFTRRRDEIGHLSGALRDMTGALYNRIEAIEMFAADVAHELEESADVAALGGRNAAAGAQREQSLAAAGGDRARRQTARPTDLRHFRRQPARRRAAAAGYDIGRSSPAAYRTDDGGQRNQARQHRRRRGPLRRPGFHRHLLGAGPRFAARPGDFQPALQRPVVFRTRRQGAHRLSPRKVGN